MTNPNPTRTLAVLTSGGDAPGMNAAVRAVVRTALARGVRVFAIRRATRAWSPAATASVEMTWESVGGILHMGGTVIGTARCAASARARAGGWRRQPAQAGIDSLVVIGGDGSLTGADMLRQEWPELLAELAAPGRGSRAQPPPAAPFSIVGLVGSIDNDMAGTDMTIGADTALHRITEAIDAIASHRRQPPAHLRGRGDGPPLRLPGADGRDRDRGELGAHPGKPARRGRLGGDDVRAPPHRPPGRPPRLASWSWPRARATGTASPITAEHVREGPGGAAQRGRARHHPGPRPARRRAERVRPLHEHAAGPRGGRGAALLGPRQRAPAHRDARTTG